MTVTDQIKILNRKIKQNESKYYLDRKAAEKSALSSRNLDKYELLTDEVQILNQVLLLKQIFNKALSEDDKKEGLFKRLKNTEGKNEEQLKAIEDQGKK